MKKILISILVALTNNISYAQDFNLDWVGAIGGSERDDINNIVVDEEGNVYTVGYFRGSLDIAPGPFIDNRTSAGQEDIFIQKLASDGSLIWARTFGSAYDDRGFGIDVESGNVFVSGQFQGTVDFDPSSSKQEMVSNGDFDVFILKLDSDGELVWVKSVGGTGSDRATDIDATPQYVRVIGYFDGSGDYDPGVGVNTLTSNGGSDAFLLELKPDGTFEFATSWGGIYNDQATAMDAQRIIGYFYETVDFDPSTKTEIATSNGSSDIFIVSYSSILGVPKLSDVLTYGGSGGDIGSDIKKSRYDARRWVVTGSFSDTVDFNPEPDVENRIAKGYGDAFVQNLYMDGSGNWNLIFVNTFGAALNAVSGSSIIETGHPDDPQIYVTGGYSGTIDFDPGSTKDELTSKGVNDIFITACTFGGNYLWTKSLGGAGSDYGSAITIDNDYKIYVGGTFQGSCNFSPTSASEIKISNGSWDAFVLKLNHPSVSTAINEIKMNGFNIYPNPSNGTLNVEAAGEGVAEICNIDGQLVFTTRLYQGINQIKTGLQSGFYFIRILNQNGVITEKIVIE